jgi:DNA polymerase-3 subunit alpha
MLESLIKAGAFDFTGADRAELFACIDESLNASAIAQRDRAAGQVSLFDEQTHAPQQRGGNRSDRGTSMKSSPTRKELLGFYVSGHPLDAYADVFAAKKLSIDCLVRRTGRSQRNSRSREQLLR